MLDLKLYLERFFGHFDSSTLCSARNACEVRLVVAKSDGVIKKRLGATSHNHESAKNKILALIVEHEELSEALQHQGATGRSLVSDIATRLRENKLLPMMSSPTAVKSRLERARRGPRARLQINPC